MSFWSLFRSKPASSEIISARQIRAGDTIVLDETTVHVTRARPLDGERGTRLTMMRYQGQTAVGLEIISDHGPLRLHPGLLVKRIAPRQVAR